MSSSRKIRIAIGAAIILLGLYFNSQWWVFGIFPVVTGIINRCPSFLTFGQSSCNIEPQKNPETEETKVEN